MTDEAKKIVYGLVCGGKDDDCENEDCFYNYLDYRTYSLKCAKGDIKSDAIRLIKWLSEELEQVKRERDAAVRDLKVINDLFREDPEMCCFCKYAHTDPDEEPCKSCNPNPVENKWEWHGVCFENSGGDVDERN